MKSLSLVFKWLIFAVIIPSSCSLPVSLLNRRMVNSLRQKALHTNSTLLPGKPIAFTLTSDPIDVVIPAVEKDLETLEVCIKGIRDNGKSVRNVYVVSRKKLTEKALWINEASFPFTMRDLAVHLFRNEARADLYLKKGTQRIGWYFQQCVKLYCPIVIPNISSNVLVLDSDTIFLNPVSFMNEKNEPLFCSSMYGIHIPYFVHAGTLIPGFKRAFPQVSGVAHHMLFQRDIINHLFRTIESRHKKPAWQAICESVPLINDGQMFDNQGLSEFELYMNYVFMNSAQGHLRDLKWCDLDFLDQVEAYKNKGYDFISCHDFRRARAREKAKERR